VRVEQSTNSAESKTVEEFKPRIAAIIRGKPEEITGAPRPHLLLVRRNKRAIYRKTKRRPKALASGLMHVYEGRPRKDKHGVDLISDVLPFGRLW
jgi:hypothetical protein